RAPTPASRSRERRRSPATCAARRASSSGPRASSCWAATATSRSTRSSAGTATSEPSASPRAPCSSEPRGTEFTMINLEVPNKFRPLVGQAHQVAAEIFRPVSRKYDQEEHAYPRELDMLAALLDGVDDGSDLGGAGAGGVRRTSNGDGEVR